MLKVRCRNQIRISIGTQEFTPTCKDCPLIEVSAHTAKLFSRCAEADA